MKNKPKATGIGPGILRHHFDMTTRPGALAKSLWDEPGEASPGGSLVPAMTTLLIALAAVGFLLGWGMP